MMENSYSAFWTDFERLTDGGSRPAVLGEHQVGASLFSPYDGMGILHRIFAADDISVNIGGRLCNEPEMVTPPETPEAYEAFVDHFAKTNDTETITFTRDYCLKYAPEVARRIRAFMQGYVAERGVPTPGVNAVFIGGQFSSV